MDSYKGVRQMFALIVLGWSLFGLVCFLIAAGVWHIIHILGGG